MTTPGEELSILVTVILLPGNPVFLASEIGTVKTFFHIERLPKPPALLDGLLEVSNCGCGLLLTIHYMAASIHFLYLARFQGGKACEVCQYSTLPQHSGQRLFSKQMAVFAGPRFGPKSIALHEHCIQ